jgi:hypothetical protein
VTAGVPVNVRNALRGEGGVGAVRELAVSPLRHGVAALLRQCCTGAGDEALTLLRTKYKPGRKLNAYYGLSDSSGTRHICVTWSLKPTDPPLVADIEEAAERRGLMAPFQRLAATSEDGCASLLIAPADPAMPELVSLNDHKYLDHLLAGMRGGSSHSTSVREARPVRYRPGQRHVLQVLDRGQRTVAFVKLDRDDSGERALRTSDIMGAVFADRCPLMRVVRPLGYSHADKASVWSPCAGRTLWQHLAVRASASPALAGLLGQALRVLHDSAVDEDPRWDGPWAAVPYREGLDEVRATARAGEHIDALLPRTALSYRTLLDDVCDRLSRLPQEPPSFVHGDVKGDNLVVEGGQLCLLDLDRCAWGDPALDLGKFLADLRWWCSRSGLDEVAMSTAFAQGYGAQPSLRWARARLLAIVLQLKLASRRFPVHEEAWSALTRGAVADAEARLRAEQTP